MHNGQLGGTIGPFRDAASGQQVSGQLSGSFSYQAQGDPSAVLPQLQQAILAATSSVLGHKLAAGQLAIPTIAMSLPHFYAEIIEQSGALQLGAQITQLNLTADIRSPAMQPAYTGPMPPTPMQALQNSAQQHAQEALDPSNYEVRAKINIGGIRIDANTTDGIDTDGLADQMVDRAKSNLIWYGVGCGILLLVALGLAGLGWYIYREAKAPLATEAPSGKAKVAEWDGSKPFSCGSGAKLTIKGVTATLKSGTAITAGANCQLELTDVTLDAPTGIKALGNAVVTVNGGSVKGKLAAASALGSGQIIFKGTKVEGKTSALGPNAKITGP